MSTSENEIPGAARADVVRAGRRNLAVYLGVFMVVLGVVLSAAVLESTVLPEGTLVGTTRRAAAWGFCRMLLIGLGLFLLLRRPRFTAVHLSACAVMSGFAAVLGMGILQLIYRPPPVLCGQKAFASPAEQNQAGYRGRRIDYAPEDFVIVLLGDSNVESMALPFDAMPEQRLEAHLRSLGKRVKVFSVGVGGYGQDQELLALEEYLRKYRADMVVLWQTPWNDIWNNLFNTQMINRNPKPTFWLEGGKLCGPSESLWQPLANSPIVIVSLWQRVFALPRRDKEWERRLPAPYVPLDHYDGPVVRDWQDRWDRNSGRMREENLKTEKSHMAVVLAPRSPRMQYGLDLTRALLRRIQEVVAAQHGQFAIFQVDESPIAREDQMFVLNGKYYRVSKRQFEENFSYLHQGFEAVDLPVTVKDARVSAEDPHFNQAGTDQLMGDLAKWLQSRVPERRDPAGTPATAASFH